MSKRHGQPVNSGPGGVPAPVSAARSVFVRDCHQRLIHLEDHDQKLAVDADHKWAQYEVEEPQESRGPVCGDEENKASQHGKHETDPKDELQVPDPIASERAPAVVRVSVRKPQRGDGLERAYS